MKISTRLKLAGILSIGAVAMIALVLFSSSLQLKKALGRNEASVEFLKAISSIQYLTLEYTLRHDDRSLLQWRLRHTSLSSLLGETDMFKGTEDEAIVNGLAQSHDRLKSLFDQLVANQTDRKNDRDNIELLEEREARLTGQIMKQVQSMISDVLILSERSRAGVREAQWLTTVAVLLFGGLAVVVVASTSYYTADRVTRPLAELHDGMRIVGAGNLDFRFRMGAIDEIDDLGRSFDVMTEKLKGTTVSRDDLAQVNRALSAELDRREHAEKELLRNQVELQTANKALEASNIELQRFAYVASHDLQTPLRSIAGFVQLLQSEYTGLFDTRAENWMQRTVQATKVMQASIRDLLTYSRVNSEADAFQDVPLREVFEDAVLLLDAAIKESGADVTCGELPTLTCDRSQMVQLMQNLVGNALKYCTQTPEIRVSSQAADTEWIFSIQDNGIGIAPKHYERIFELFKRLHSEKEYPGTGIGLAVCRRVVNRHGGRIWVESESGRGSIFYFTIPIAEVGTV